MIKTKPFKHQAEVYNAHRDDPFFALLWEMGLGKSKVILDVASHLHAEGKITALAIMAPNAVYTNWLTQEAPMHLAAPHIKMAYPKAKSHRARLKRMLFLDPEFEPGKLKFVAISYDSIRTDYGCEFMDNLVLLHKTMLVADESTAIKTPSAKCTKMAKRFGKRAHYRWICTGTPVAQSPFDIHSQVEFLCPGFWKGHGLRTFGAFKTEFGSYVTRRTAGGRQFPELKSYRQLDKLTRMIKPISSRLLKEDSEVELPPKMYSVRTFQMIGKQRAIYDHLRTEFLAEINTGVMIEAPLAIVRLARLQQIASGFVTAEEYVDDDTYEMPVLDSSAYTTANLTQEVKVIQSSRRVKNIVEPADNPRLNLLLSLLNEASHKVIVWCRFRRDVDNIVNAIGVRCVRYDGAVNGRDREDALNRFRDPDDKAQFLVANVHALSHGVTLTIAKTMIYYSNSFSLEKRLQSEDRFHRIGQDQPVHIIDIAGENTVDEHIIRALRSKYDIAAAVMGDRLREWVTV